MSKRIIRLLSVAVLATTMAGLPAAARADTSAAGSGVATTLSTERAAALAAAPSLTEATADVIIQSGVGCGRYLATVYGGVRRCTIVSGNTGEVGFTSQLTGGWSPTYRASVVREVTVAGPVTATDGVRGQFFGYAYLSSAFGPVVHGTQYHPDGRRARWGNVNDITDTFYPDSGWLNLV
jgi:hypothetical protein